MSFWVAEANVVLDEARTISGEHQPGENDANVRSRSGCEVVEYWLDECFDQFGAAECDRCGGVGAHAAGVRANVAFADALVVLSER